VALNGISIHGRRVVDNPACRVEGKMNLVYTPEFICQPCEGEGVVFLNGYWVVCPSCTGRGWRDDPYKDWLD